jgi:hypothetical protein
MSNPKFVSNFNKNDFSRKCLYIQVKILRKEENLLSAS